ncbi:NADP Isocitrate dehydrogenase [Escherichia coli]|nr:NADP Isocitrate dehydrogenase [Escherichia coli]
MLSGESVKEKKTAASFVVTFIFIGYASSNTRWDKTEAHIALYWIARLCALR